jgi:hypothetical protein
MYNMNKQRGAHMEGQGGDSIKGAHDVEQGSGQHLPHIHIHSHSQGHTVHIMHHSGQHEKFEHSHGDAQGMAEHIHQHLGGAADDVQSEGAPMPLEQGEMD